MRYLDPNKGLFTIGVAAEIVGVESRVLRMYEKKELLAPSRTDGNRRLYSLKDLELLEYIHYITHVRKVNLAGVKTILELLARLPEDLRRHEMTSVESATDHLDETARRIFAKGSSTVERELLDEQLESDIHREAESEVEGHRGAAV